MTQEIHTFETNIFDTLHIVFDTDCITPESYDLITRNVDRLDVYSMNDVYRIDIKIHNTSKDLIVMHAQDITAAIYTGNYMDLVVILQLCKKKNEKKLARESKRQLKKYESDVSQLKKMLED